jgi:hypothetical protein
MLSAAEVVVRVAWTSEMVAAGISSPKIQSTS